MELIPEKLNTSGNISKTCCNTSHREPTRQLLTKLLLVVETLDHREVDKTNEHAFVTDNLRLAIVINWLIPC